MSGIKRFYYEGRPQDGRIILDAKQSHHLKNVLRLRKNSQVEIFNNKGEGFTSRVAAIKDGVVELKVSGSSIKSASSLEITIATAIPKGGRMDWLVEKAAELGAKELIPLVTQRSIIKDVSGKLRRWQNLAVAAAKQTGQNNVLQVQPAVLFKNILPCASGYDLALIAVPSAAEGSLQESIGGSLSGKAGNIKRILYLIGPEGDFTGEEVKQAVDAGFKPVRLPVASVLRVETAAIALLAMLVYGFTEFLRNGK